MVGIIRVLLGATLDLTLKDSKKSLAYSTMSQLSCIGLHDYIQKCRSKTNVQNLYQESLVIFMPFFPFKSEYKWMIAMTHAAVEHSV